MNNSGVYVPNANFCGTDTFVYQVTDTFGPEGSNVVTGSIIVACVNDAPVAVDQVLAINEDNTGSIIFTSGSSDVDAGDTISLYGIITSPSNGTLTTGGIYTPTANFCGTDVFTFKLKDTANLSGNIATGTVTITCVNDAPVAVADGGTTNSGSAVTLDVTANDTDADNAYVAQTLTIT